MKKRTGEMKNRRSIGELQKKLTLTRRALKAAQGRIDWMVETILDNRGDTLKRIRFLEQQMVFDHESGLHQAEKELDAKWMTEELREKIRASAKYKFPEWIERDRKNGLYNLDTGHQAAA